MHISPLPVTRDLRLAYILSLAVAILMTAASLAGLLFPEALYPGEDLSTAFVPNDVVNLCLGLPILLGSMAQARGGRLLGLLFWPGALLYTLYNYIAYTIALSLSLGGLVYIVLVVLCAWAVLFLVSSMDMATIKQRLGGLVPEKLGGGVLVGLGGLFFIMRIGVIIQTLSGQGQNRAEGSVAIADLVIMPLLVLGGVWLWQKKPLGYACGAGLLFQGSMLFVGLLAIFILQPVLLPVPFALVDFIVVFAMGLVCFIPFGLFLRGIAGESKIP